MDLQIFGHAGKCMLMMKTINLGQYHRQYHRLDFRARAHFPNSGWESSLLVPTEYGLPRSTYLRPPLHVFAVQVPLRCGGKSHGQPNFQRKNNNNKADSFIRLNFNVYINLYNRGRANFFVRITCKFYGGGKKMTNASGSHGENEWQRTKK